jgi:spore germination cell wall hydrolase CwlJ-like protein
MSEAPARVVALTGAVIAQSGQEVPLVDIPGKGSKRRVTLVAAAVALGGYLTTAAPTAGAAAGIDVKGELECLALTIYFEARGEPDEGKLAVGHVVMNRTQHPLFPPRVCLVVRQGGDKLRYHCQFTWWCDGRSDRPRDRQAWTKSRALAGLVYWNYSRDPTAGALWYHADYVWPKWRHNLKPGPKIGRHMFYGLTEVRHNKLAPIRTDASHAPE